MAATLVPAESWCGMNGYDESGGNLDDFSQIDGALLMSLLDDTQAVVEDYDDERLRGVIQSLEAEITVDGNNNCQPSDAAQLHGQDVSEFNGPDLRLMDMVDMEIITEPSFPTPNDGFNYWYHCDDHEMDGVDEYCSRVHFEDISDNYGFLWQESNNASSALRQG